MTSSTLQITPVIYGVEVRVNVCETIICLNSLFFPFTVNEKYSHSVFLTIPMIYYCSVNHPKIQCLKTNFVILFHGSLRRIGLAGQLWVKICHALLVWRCLDWKPSTFSHAHACVGVWPEEWGAGPASLSFHVTSLGCLPAPWLWAVRLQGQHSTHPRPKLQDLLWAGLGTPIGVLMSQLLDQASH